MPNNNPHSDISTLSDHLNRPYPTPTICGFHLGFGLGQLGILHLGYEYYLATPDLPDNLFAIQRNQTGYA